jgi:stage III sporulation protein SpoIIIAA
LSPTQLYMSLHTDGLTQFLDVLPSIVRERLERSEGLDSLIEVVLDYGRPAEARYRDRVERYPDVLVSELDIEHVAKKISEFGTDNRAGIERTLHRTSHAGSAEPSKAQSTSSTTSYGQGSRFCS